MTFAENPSARSFSSSSLTSLLHGVSKTLEMSLSAAVPKYECRVQPRGLVCHPGPSWPPECPPVNFASVERFGVEGDGGGVAALDAADGDFSAQFDPGHGEDGAGVGAGQREDVLFIVLQQTEDS